MKQKDIERLLQANPAAMRDRKAVEKARDAIKQRRKEGYVGKGYDLAPTFGSKRLELSKSRKELPKVVSKMTLMLD